MSSIVRVACIGSREISPNESELFVKVGEYIVSQGWYISSGCADGSDYCFMKGGNNINPKNILAYLPWPKYNNQYLHKDNKICWNPLSEWEELTKPFHGAWDKLSQGGRKLMQRNYGIIHRADKVIARLNPNKPHGGGTAQGVKIARHLGIPVLDLNNKTFEEIVVFLHE